MYLDNAPEDYVLPAGYSLGCTVYHSQVGGSGILQRLTLSRISGAVVPVVKWSDGLVSVMVSWSYITLKKD
jgi:hypothetical protein